LEYGMIGSFKLGKDVKSISVNFVFAGWLGEFELTIFLMQ